MNIDQSKQTNTLTLCHALGWQGGTIHQVSKEIGLPLDDILDLHNHEPNDKSINSEDSRGWFAVRTCSREHFLDKCVPSQKGNKNFWYGVLSGLYSKEVLGV